VVSTTGWHGGCFEFPERKTQYPCRSGLAYPKVRLSETAHRLAVILGQDADLLRQVEAEEVHPAMAAFGLWNGVEELAMLADEIAANRERPSRRVEVAR
jgi:hypothetical protein